ncbi:YciI family protein [Rhodococcus sp. NPDC055112]
MKYLLLMQIDPEVMAALSEDDRNAIMTGHGEFIKTIQQSGEMVITQALADPTNSTVVRSRDGVPAVTDGPYLEAKEYMGGYYMVDVENKERAIELALQIPDTKIDGLAIEVRPVMFTGGPDM